VSAGRRERCAPLGKIGAGGALLPRQGDRVQNRTIGEQSGHASDRRLGIIAVIIGGQIMDLLDKGIANDLGRIGRVGQLDDIIGVGVVGFSHIYPHSS